MRRGQLVSRQQRQNVRVLGSESFNPVTVGMGIPDSTEVINVPLHLGLPLRGSLRGGTFLASSHAKYC